MSFAASSIIDMKVTPKRQTAYGRTAVKAPARRQVAVFGAKVCFVGANVWFFS